jgi:hypothetical protein
MEHPLSEIEALIHRAERLLEDRRKLLQDIRQVDRRHTTLAGEASRDQTAAVDTPQIDMNDVRYLTGKRQMASVIKSAPVQRAGAPDARAASENPRRG